MNVSLSSRHTVHAQHTAGAGPACHNFGAPHGSESYRNTTREVTCKKCLKILAAQAETVTEVAETVETPAAEVVAVETVQDEVIVTLAAEVSALATQAAATAPRKTVAAYVEAFSRTPEQIQAAPQKSGRWVVPNPPLDFRPREAVTVLVDLVTPTKALVTIVGSGTGGIVLNDGRRGGGKGWSAEDEDGQQVTSGQPSLDAAVRALVRSYGITRPVRTEVHHEYRDTGERD